MKCIDGCTQTRGVEVRNRDKSQCRHSCGHSFVLVADKGQRHPAMYKTYVLTIRHKSDPLLASVPVPIQVTSTYGFPQLLRCGADIVPTIRNIKKYA